MLLLLLGAGKLRGIKLGRIAHKGGWIHRGRRGIGAEMVHARMACADDMAIGLGIDVEEVMVGGGSVVDPGAQSKADAKQPIGSWVRLRQSAARKWKTRMQVG